MKKQFGHFRTSDRNKQTHRFNQCDSLGCQYCGGGGGGWEVGQAGIKVKSFVNPRGMSATIILHLTWMSWMMLCWKWKPKKFSPRGLPVSLKAKAITWVRNIFPAKPSAWQVWPAEVLLGSQRRIAGAGVVCGGLGCGPSAAAPAVHLTFTRGVTSTRGTWERGSCVYSNVL